MHCLGGSLGGDRLNRQTAGKTGVGRDGDPQGRIHRRGRRDIHDALAIEDGGRWPRLQPVGVIHKPDQPFGGQRRFGEAQSIRNHFAPDLGPHKCSRQQGRALSQGLRDLQKERAQSRIPAQMSTFPDDTGLPGGLLDRKSTV